MLSWDRSRDWVVQRCYHDLTRVTIQFAGTSPSVTELLSLRRCLPQFQYNSPAQLREQLSHSNTLALGAMPTRQAHQIMSAARSAGLQVNSENASFVSYLPYDRTGKCAWLIEDDAEAEQVATEMIAAGVPVENIEA